jgi:photosystem II stability/assembly factor-like uncharacterized protein
MGQPSWQIVETGSPHTLIVVNVLRPDVVWAAGGGFDPDNTNNGSVVRTVNGGETWQIITPPNGTARAFRDVEARYPNRAVALASFPVPSQISRTVDGGQTWQEAFTAAENDFYDSLAFFNRRHLAFLNRRPGLAVSDPVNNKFPILATRDGGKTWDLLESTGTDAEAGEAALATGTCLVAAGSKNAWFGTSFDRDVAPNAKARVFHTRNKGKKWTAATTPIPGAPRGIGSLSFRDRMNGLALGGSPPPEFEGTDTGLVARTSDGGHTWSLVEEPSGFRHGVAWIGHDTAVVVGPTGSDISHDGGNTWTPIPDSPFLLGVACRKDACWAVGRDGIAARLII